MYSREPSLRDFAEWWVYGLVAIAAVMVLEFIASVRSVVLVWVPAQVGISNSIPGNEVPGNALESSLFESSSLDTDYTRMRVHVESWVGWTTRFYVVLVLTTALVGWFSMMYGSPLWYGFVLFAVPFVGALLVYRTWPKEEEY
jgi:hypothetical protein